MKIFDFFFELNARKQNITQECLLVRLGCRKHPIDS
jgi:hypothetical protein